MRIRHHGPVGRLRQSLNSSVILVCVVAHIAGSQVVQGQDVSYKDWKARCLQTPANRVLMGRFPSKDQLPLKDFQVVRQLVGHVAECDDVV